MVAVAVRDQTAPRPSPSRSRMVRRHPGDAAVEWRPDPAIGPVAVVVDSPRPLERAGRDDRCAGVASSWAAARWASGRSAAKSAGSRGRRGGRSARVRCRRRWPRGCPRQGLPFRPRPGTGDDPSISGGRGVRPLGSSGRRVPRLGNESTVSAVEISSSTSRESNRRPVGDRPASLQDACSSVPVRRTSVTAVQGWSRIPTCVAEIRADL